MRFNADINKLISKKILVIYGKEIDKPPMIADGRVISIQISKMGRI